MDDTQSTGIQRDHEALADDANGEIGPIIPTMGDWARILAPMCLDAQIPLPFALAWIDAESGGNVCGVGEPSGPQSHGDSTDPKYAKHPREMGIAQIFNPDDFIALNLNPASFRAYCGPEVDGRFPQNITRPLTPSEIHDQARSLVGKIGQSMSKTRRQLQAIHAGSSWAPDRQNFWRLVKLQHAIPGLASVGLPAVTTRIGRPPVDWAEFRHAIATTKLDRGTESKRKKFNSAFDNAEKTASAVVEKAVA